jgi:uncharacterized protein (DUF302 family)
MNSTFHPDRPQRRSAKGGNENATYQAAGFRDPKPGTPVMAAAPSSAIDLPLKILIWEDAQGKVWVTYNTAVYLRERHNIPTELLPNLSVIEAMAKSAAE